jgi:hemolysin activation/secretion protein
MTIFSPPPATPSVIELPLPRFGATPTRIASHGYRYVVAGNTLLPDLVIQKVLAKASSPKIAVNTLLKAYHARGYTLVAVTGQVKGKTVSIDVYEGLINSFVAPNAIKRFFPGITERQNLRNATLVRDQILSDTYAQRSGKTLRVNLSPGTNPGSSALTISESKKADYFPISGALTFGNYGSRYASGYVAGAQLAANLTHGIQITGNFTQGLAGLRPVSYGSSYYQDGVGASVATPYGLYGFNTSWTHYRLGQSTYPLYPDGNVFTYAFTGSQLMFANTSTRFTLNESLTHVRYRETLLNGFYTLLNQHYNYISGGAAVDRSMSLLGRTGDISGSLTLNIGISPESGTLLDNARGIPTSHFRYTDFSAGYKQALPYGFQTNLTGQAQWSVSTLPSQQQWVLGGLGTLSAWEPGVETGDSGYLARLELDAPSFKRLGSDAQFGLFLETGGVALANPSPGTPPWQTLSDVGVSLRLKLPLGFSVTTMAATPIHTSAYNRSTRANLKVNRINAFFVVQKGF